MMWESELTEAILLKRYKRFLADIKLGENEFTIHVPNTGSMQSCWEPQWKCAISTSKNPHRKMPHTLELIHNGTSWIGVNTALTNTLVKSWLSENLIPELSDYSIILPEKKIKESRIDFYLDGHKSLPACYVEVKNVTLKLEGKAQFPDSISERGQKHLRELMHLKEQGYRAVMLYVVQREDVSHFSPASTIDPIYAKLFKEAHAAGVEILVYQTTIDLNGIKLGKPLPFSF